MKSLIMILVLAVGASTLGCGGEKTTGGGAAAGGKGAAAADSGGGGGGGPRITKFRFGSGTDPNGIVINETEKFRPEETPSVSFEVKNVPANSQVKAVWNDSSKKKISEEQKMPGSGGAVTFQFKGSPTVPEGDYVVEFFYGDPAPPPGKWTFLGTKSFHVGQKAP